MKKFSINEGNTEILLILYFVTRTYINVERTMNQGLPTYCNFVSNGNRQISAKYVVDNLVMCENRVNTHILIARILQIFKGTLASRNYDRAAETSWNDISGVTATDITPLCNAYTAPATDTPNATAEGVEII